MLIPKIIIAIDGYSSTGKSSFAKLIAKQFSFLYLDSGALYRAVTLYALNKGYIAQNGCIDIAKLGLDINNLDICFKEVDGVIATYMNGNNIEKDIRSLRVSSFVSPIATIKEVRNFVDKTLRNLATSGGVVMDGRDIGTTVFPNAELKIFMVASASIRAERRYKEMLSNGESPKLDDVLNNLKERDYIDSHREMSPLRQAEDAIILDNSYLTMEQQIKWVEWVIANKFN